jgi:opacity protein-like surface antigen
MSWKVPAAASLIIVIVLAVVQIVITNLNSGSPAKPIVIASESPTPSATPTDSASPTPSSSATATPTTAGVNLTITAARGNSRIDIVINGVHVEKGSIFQGETKSYTSDTSISVYFSNPAGLDVTLNGELQPALGGQNQEVRRTFR